MPLEAPAITSFPADELGAPGRADPERCAVLALRLLNAAAGEGMALASVTLDTGPAVMAAGDEVAIETKTDKRTRTVVFASVSASSGGEIVFAARGLFSAS